MQSFIAGVIVVSSLTLVASILLQSGSGGLGVVFGGSSGGEGYKARRGLQKFLYYVTIFGGIILVLSCLLYFVV